MRADAAAGARRELDGPRRDADARTETLSQSHAEQETALKAAQDAARREAPSRRWLEEAVPTSAMR